MAWFKRKSDPISSRERVLADEIARLEAQIKRLDSSLREGQTKGTGSVPQNNGYGNVTHPSTPNPSNNLNPQNRREAAPPGEPIFERVLVDRLAARPDNANTSSHYNDLGVRKYDLPALLSRLRNHFRGPSASNPKLVSYLAAGGIQGLRPLRYEKRVARNRFIVLVIGLFFMLLGLIWTYIKHSR